MSVLRITEPVIPQVTPVLARKCVTGILGSEWNRTATQQFNEIVNNQYPPSGKAALLRWGGVQSRW
jgi:hypothetical protein